MTANAEINPQRYGRLLAKARPGVIASEPENERLLVEVERLMLKRQLSPEEEKLLDLRQISKAHAKKLAQFFQVSAELFI